MESLNDFLNQISNLGSKLNGLSGFSLTVLTCLLWGFALKKMPKIPNTRIPTILIFTGVVLGMLLADPLVPPMFFRIWLVKNGVVGGLAGGVAWALHSNRRKIPFVKMFFKDDGNSDPRAFVKSEMPVEKPKE